MGISTLQGTHGRQIEQVSGAMLGLLPLDIMTKVVGRSAALKARRQLEAAR